MKKSLILLITMISMSMSVPAYAASWGALEKGACEATSGKRVYTAKLKRNFGDEPAASLCPRLHKTVDGKSRVPDKCVKKAMSGYVGVWLVSDKTCARKDVIREFTPITSAARRKTL